MKQRIFDFFDPSKKAEAYLRKLHYYKSKSKVISIFYRWKLLKKFAIHASRFGTWHLGSNIKIPHPMGIVIGEGTEIGNDCTIYHNVTLGRKFPKECINDYPKIGNNVTIYTGCLIVGPIKIGDNSIVLANSVVSNDIPSNSIYDGRKVKSIKKLK